MKKFIAWLLVLTLTAAVSIGATLAYLTDTDEDVNVMTLGKVKIDQLEYERIDDETANEDAKVQEFHDNKPLYPAVTGNGFDYTPGDTKVDWAQIGKVGYTSEIWNPENINNELDKMVFIKNKGDYDAFVRTVFAFEAGNYTTLDQFKSMVHMNLNESDYAWEWVETPVEIPNEEGGTTKYFIATATYNKTLAPGTLTEISLSQIALDKTATNADVEAFGETYQILVKSQGIQADGFTDPVVALNEGFGAIRTENIPWESDSPTRGIDLKKALHYYEGGTTQITGSVANVTFGLKSTYPAIVNSDSGTLVDVEQDVPAYAYYVKNGATYDIYVLSDSTIYAPANSLGLFASMGSLKTVKGKLDVSRVTTMESMFDYCGALQSVDASGWDTGKVTSMTYMFYGCQNLSELDTSSWNLSNVKSMKMTFYNCISLAELDVSGWGVDSVEDMNQVFCQCSSLTALDTADWNTGSVVDMGYMFYQCGNLETVNVSDWDVSKVQSFKGTFYGCPKLNGLDVSNWNTSNATRMDMMFYGDYSLEYLDVSDWDVSKVEHFGWIFASMNQNAGDMKLQNLDLSAWNPVSATSVGAMFYGCGSLTELDLSGWNMPKLTDASHMFSDCFKLQTLDVSGWQTPSLVTMDGMFNDCRVLQSLDMSSFDTSNVKEFSQLFEACYALEEIKGMGNWDTSSACTFTQMFSGCGKLKELDLSAFNTGNARDNYTDMNNSKSDAFTTMFSGVNKLEKLIVGDQIKYLGNGNVAAGNRLTFPNPVAKEGYIAKWQNVDTGAVYLGKDIPEKTAATYVPYYEYASQGATIKEALTYLNADSSSTNITSKIANVTFGLRKDYEAITSQYTGVLADAEQDGPVHAYYVENGAYYDLYFLSDGKIYTPKDSTYLFSGLPQLLTINTENLDVSRTEIMFTMFYNSPKLHTLDVSNWDTSNVTTMRAMFSQCASLPYLNVSNWDVRNVQSTAKMFYNCLALHDLVGLGNWQTSSLTECNSMFSSGSSNTGNMPFDTQDLAVGNWDMSDVTNAGYMFYGCGSLEEIDLSNWDTSNMETFHHFFCDCYNLKKVNFSGWDTSKVTTFDAMFNHCISLEVLDLSSFDTSACTDMAQMFEICESLKTIYVGDGWDTSNIAYSFEIFSGCKTLVGGAGTAFVGSGLQYAHVDGGEENPGYLTYKAPETTNP